MTRYQVDSDAVLQASSAIRATIGRLQSEVGSLHGQLEGLQGSWSGVAATSFQTVATEWKATQQRVEENLSALNLALAQAGQHYAETERQNASYFMR